MTNLHTEVRFSIVPEWVIDADISDRAVRVYAILARYADSETHQAFPSRETLAKRARCHWRSIDRAIGELIALGAVTKTHRKNGKEYQSNIYTLKRVLPRVSRGTATDDSGVLTGESVGTDTAGNLTRTTELEPSEQELLNKGFATFWAVYPKKDDKPLAKRSFEKALKRATLEQIVDGAERYRDDPNREDLFTKNPSTWLNADAWENGPLPSRVVRKPRKLTNAEEGALLVAKWRAEEAAEEQKQIGYDMGIKLKGVDDE
jgi:hypothetical protein